MKKLNGKIVFITGASAGIGKACAEQFAACGANVILTARRLELIQALAQQLETEYGVQALALPLDVSNANQVTNTVSGLPAQWANIDILVNNAGVGVTTELMHKASTTDWDNIIDVNLKGFLYVAHAVSQIMVKQESGHIINIGSVAGRSCYPGGNVYAATKHAVRALSDSLRLELRGLGIRVTEIAPGAVHTEFSEKRWDKARSDAFYAKFQALYAEDVADAVVYSATRPKHVMINELVVCPTEQPAALNLDAVHNNKNI